MIDVVQMILLAIIVVVAIVVVILGIQVFYILREVRKTVQKANRVLDNTNAITDSLSQPLSALSSVVGGFTAGSVISKIVRIGLRAVSGDKKQNRKEEDGE